MPFKIKNFLSFFKKKAELLYFLLKPIYEKSCRRRGRRYSRGLLEQIAITLYKLRFNLPVRALESLFGVDSVTISRIVLRVVKWMNQLNFKMPVENSDNNWIVDSTLLRTARQKSGSAFTGYKHFDGIKIQIVIDSTNKIIQAVSNPYPANWHDKRIFLAEWKKVSNKINRGFSILGDKAYVGLESYGVEVPKKRNELQYKANPALAQQGNRELSRKRVKVEHIFAWLKNFRIGFNNYYYSVDKIGKFVKSLINLYNCEQLIKLGELKI